MYVLFTRIRFRFVLMIVLMQVLVVVLQQACLLKAVQVISNVCVLFEFHCLFAVARWADAEDRVQVDAY